MKDYRVQRASNMQRAASSVTSFSHPNHSTDATLPEGGDETHVTQPGHISCFPSSNGKTMVADLAGLKSDCTYLAAVGLGPTPFLAQSLTCQESKPPREERAQKCVNHPQDCCRSLRISTSPALNRPGIELLGLPFPSRLVGEEIGTVVRSLLDPHPPCPKSSP